MAWQAGDLAICVGRGADDVYDIDGATPQTRGPIVGLTYTVAAAHVGFDCYGRPGTALRFNEIPNKHPKAIGYNANFFRKIAPHVADAEDAETIRLMNGQPVPVEG